MFSLHTESFTVDFVLLGFNLCKKPVSCWASYKHILFSRSKPSCNSLKTLHARDGCWNNWRLVPIFAVRTNWAMLLFRSFSSLVKSFELNNNNWYWKERQRESRSKSTLILNVNYAFVINHRLWVLGQYAENLIRLSLQLDFIFISTGITSVLHGKIKLDSC